MKISNKLTVLCAAVTVLFGCTPREEVRRETFGEKRTVETIKSCYTTGICFTCMPGWNMKMSCTLKFSAFCSGRQAVTLERTSVHVYYKDGTVEDLVEDKILGKGPCKL